MSILKNSFLTKNLSQFENQIIAKAMFKKDFPKDELIIRYGKAKPILSFKQFV
jgi:hypothetical protein